MRRNLCGGLERGEEGERGVMRGERERMYFMPVYKLSVW